MANYIHPDVLDNGLVTLTNATSTALHLCSSQPTTRAEALSASLANKSSPSIGSPAAGTGAGRKVTVAAVTTGGSVTSTGTAAYWAIIDGTRLLSTGTHTSQALTSGNTFTTTAFDISIPGAA